MSFADGSRTPLRRVATLLLVAGIVLMSVPASASAWSAAPAQDQNDDDIPADAGRIIGSPEAGPDPQQSGDRGGWAQLLTFGVMTGGVGFVAWRIVHGVRQTPKPAPDS